MKYEPPKKSRKVIAMEFNKSIRDKAEYFKMGSTGSRETDNKAHIFRNPIKRNETMIQTIRHQVLNAIWIIKFKMVDDHNVEILAYYRDHNDTKSVEINELTGTLKEGPKRIVHSLKTYTYKGYTAHPIDMKVTEYTVSNPKHIFSYGRGE